MEACFSAVVSMEALVVFITSPAYFGPKNSYLHSVVHVSLDIVVACFILRDLSPGVLLTSLHDFVPCPVSRIYSRSFRDLHKYDSTFDSSTTLCI